MRNAASGLGLLITALLAACAGISGETYGSGRATDIWDASLIPVQHLDLQTISFSAGSNDVSGFTSAIAVQGDSLFVIDTGTRRVLEVSMSTQTLRVLGSLRSGDSRGLLVARNGLVYALDPADRSILTIDPFLGRQQRISLDGFVAKPVDLALIDDRDLVVVDALDGAIVQLDVPGGVYREQAVFRPQHPAITSPRAAAYVAGNLLVLDERMEEVIGFELTTGVSGMFAGGALRGARAMAADSCGRFFVADNDDGTLYMGIPDMSIPGIRLIVDELAGNDVTDLWADGPFLYAATQSSGIFVYLVDPGCD